MTDPDRELERRLEEAGIDHDILLQIKDFNDKYSETIGKKRLDRVLLGISIAAIVGATGLLGYTLLQNRTKNNVPSVKMESTKKHNEGYIDVNDKKFYYKMDGKPVEEYNKEKE